MSAFGRRHAARHDEGNAERWLLTYADMITLLLALFIVLFSFSSIDVKKFLELRLGLTAAFNPSAVAESGGNGILDQTSLSSMPGTDSTRVGATAPDETTAAATSATEATGMTTSSATSSTTIANEIKAALTRAGYTSDAVVTVSKRGVTVQILADKAFFATDSASLRPAGRKVVDVVASVVRGYPNDLVVEGYTDSTPVTGGTFTSNWELSAVRAANVVERLNRVDGIEATRLSSQGFGDTDPIASNLTAFGRQENRRVDVVVLDTTN